jgi:hypothetical protein
MLLLLIFFLSLRANNEMRFMGKLGREIGEVISGLVPPRSPVNKNTFPKIEKVTDAPFDASGHLQQYLFDNVVVFV